MHADTLPAYINGNATGAWSAVFNEQSYKKISPQTNYFSHKIILFHQKFTKASETLLSRPSPKPPSTPVPPPGSPSSAPPLLHFTGLFRTFVAKLFGLPAVYPYIYTLFYIAAEHRVGSLRLPKKSSITKKTI